MESGRFKMLEEEVLEFFGGEATIRERMRVYVTNEISLLPEDKKDILIEWYGPDFQAILRKGRIPTIEQLESLDFYFHNHNYFLVMFPRKDLGIEEAAHWAAKLAEAGVETVDMHGGMTPSLYEDMGASHSWP